MNKATLVYILMTVVFACGLWAILGIGRTLAAPADLAGTWEPASAVDPAPKLVIEQSGKFAEVSIDDGPRLQMRVAEQQPDPADPKHIRLKLVHADVTLHAAGVARGDAFDFELADKRSQTRQTWQARRVVRKYPVAKGPDGRDLPESSVVTHARN
jgi:hypothetical protein